MLRSICSIVLKLIGWKVYMDDYPYELKKFVVAVAPHTSNWDFPLGIIARTVIQQDIKFAGKDSLFKPAILGVIFKSLGGYPVDRSGKANMVEAIIDIFKKETEFKLLIAPEGTRKKVDRFKTGFYYIAKGAEVPIVLCKFDYAKKVISFSAPYYPTDDKEADFKFFMAYFDGIRGKKPQNSIGWHN